MTYSHAQRIAIRRAHNLTDDSTADEIKDAVSKIKNAFYDEKPQRFEVLKNTSYRTGYPEERWDEVVEHIANGKANYLHIVVDSATVIARDFFVSNGEIVIPMIGHITKDMDDLIVVTIGPNESVPWNDIEWIDGRILAWDDLHGSHVAIATGQHLWNFEGKMVGITTLCEHFVQVCPRDFHIIDAFTKRADESPRPEEDEDWIKELLGEESNE